jgi:hypothetical protein
MLDNNSLIKYFVRVPSGTSFNGAQVSNANATNQKKIYFDENTQQIWVKGKSFSLDKAIATAIQTLIGSDTNMSVRAIAGDVVTTALNLTDNADQTINTLKEVLNWFNNLPEGDAGALELINRVGKPAELYTAETAGTYNTANGLQEGDPNYKTAGDVKTPATGLYKVIEDAIDSYNINIAYPSGSGMTVTVPDAAQEVLDNLEGNHTYEFNILHGVLAVMDITDTGE